MRARRSRRPRLARPRRLRRLTLARCDRVTREEPTKPGLSAAQRFGRDVDVRRRVFAQALDHEGAALVEKRSPARRRQEGEQAEKLDALGRRGRVHARPCARRERGEVHALHADLLRRPRSIVLPSSSSSARRSARLRTAAEVSSRGAGKISRAMRDVGSGRPIPTGRAEAALFVSSPGGVAALRTAPGFALSGRSRRASRSSAVTLAPRALRNTATRQRPCSSRRLRGRARPADGMRSAAKRTLPELVSRTRPSSRPALASEPPRGERLTGGPNSRPRF